MRPSTVLAALLLSSSASLAAAAGLQHHGMHLDNSVQVRPGFSVKIPNLPGKSFKTVVVTYAPGASSPPHRHAGSAFVYAQVLEGEIRSQVEGQEARVYKMGEFWSESPGDHHLVSQNASATQPAKLLAVFVVDTNDGVLTIPDK